MNKPMPSWNDLAGNKKSTSYNKLTSFKKSSSPVKPAPSRGTV